MPSLPLRLDRQDIAELSAVAAEARGPARLSPGILAQRIVRQHLAQGRGRRAARVAELLRAHARLAERYPPRRRPRLSDQLQDQALGCIATGSAWLIPDLLRAGDWDRQIATLARRWRQEGLSLDELCSAGKVGLLRAISRYRPGGGFRSFAYLWIKKELERACRYGGSIVMETEQEMRVRRTVEKQARKGLDPAAIATATGLSSAQVEQGLRGRRALGWKDITDERTS